MDTEKEIIYYLENRGWPWIYHFLAYSMGGLQYIYKKDKPVKIYIPYMKKDIAPVDREYIARLTGRGDYEITYPYVYGGPNFSFTTADINYEIVHLFEPEFQFIDTLSGIDLDAIEVRSFVGEPGSNCSVPNITHVYLRNFVLSKIPTSIIEKGKRVYLTRKNSNNLTINNGILKRHVLNEDEMMEALIPLNFEYIHLENLSLKEKIHLFQTSEIILSPNSGGLTFSIFANHHTTIIELMPIFSIGDQYFTKQEQFLEIGRAVGIDIHRFQEMKRVESELNMEVDVPKLVDHVQTIIKNRYT